FPAEIGHLDRIIIAFTEKTISIALQQKLCVLEFAEHRFGRGDLGHGTVKAVVPGGVLARMARLTSLRADVPGVLQARDRFLDYSLMLCAGEALPRENSSARKQNNRCRERDQSRTFLRSHCTDER